MEHLKENQHDKANSLQKRFPKGNWDGCLEKENNMDQKEIAGILTLIRISAIFVCL